MRWLVRFLALLMVLVAAWPAAASNGSIRCRATDSRGRRVDGTCTAAQGSTRRSCTTAAGSCTIGDLAPGDWTVSFAPRGGPAPASRTVRVTSGATVTVVLTVPGGTSSGATDVQGGGTLATSGSVASGDAGTGGTTTADAGTAASADAGARPDTSARADAGTAASGTSGTTSPGDAGTATASGDSARSAAAVVGGSVVSSGAATSPPDRSTGTTLALQGRASDNRGRAIDGTVTVSKDGLAIGRAHTAGGDYHLYDLPAGTLTLTFRSLGGVTVTRSVTYSGSPLTVNLSTP